VPQPLTNDIDFVKLTEFDFISDKNLIEGTGQPSKIMYFCQDCKKLITPSRIGKRLRFACTECKGENVAFGTEKSLRLFYHIPEGSIEAKD